MAEYEVELRASAFTSVNVEAESAHDAEKKALDMAFRQDIDGPVDYYGWEIEEVNQRRPADHPRPSW